MCHRGMEMACWFPSFLGWIFAHVLRVHARVGVCTTVMCNHGTSAQQTLLAPVLNPTGALVVPQFGVTTVLLAGEKLLSPSSFSPLQLLHGERMSGEKMTGLLGHFLCRKGSGEMKSPRSPFCKRRLSLLPRWRTERAPLQHGAGRGPVPLWCFGAVFSPVLGLCCEPAPCCPWGEACRAAPNS